MVFVGAEHNRFLHSVRAFHVLCDFARNLFGAVFDDDVVVKIAVCVNAVFDFLTVFIELPLIRAPAFPDIRANIDDPKRR
ncbi:hypothetical protein SDC9_115201 [bioreactor metagenome]|uniref:Uncharacterized protein n=1 Tax=bioreactor metagenome TaxID=1076179 RepID=A0A645BS68_9ZZZZ